LINYLVFQHLALLYLIIVHNHSSIAPLPGWIR